MFNHVWSVICQNSSVDEKSNTVSLFGCIENIGVDIVKDKNKNITDKINIPIQFDVVSYWTIEDSTKKNNLFFKVELFKPNGESLFYKEETIFTEIGWSRIRNIAKFSGLELEINDSGRYNFKIFQKENRNDDFVVVAVLPVDININIK
jgi:hypothetical protein